MILRLRRHKINKKWWLVECGSYTKKKKNGAKNDPEISELVEKMGKRVVDSLKTENTGRGYIQSG